MKYIIYLALLCTGLSSLAQNRNERYIGLIEMCDIDTNGLKTCMVDSSNLDVDWFHLTHIKFIGDSVFLDQNPITIHRTTGDTMYSASDGGFNYYYGTYEQKGLRFVLHCKQLFCDYCAIQVDSNGKLIHRNYIFKGEFSSDSTLIIKNQVFTKSDLSYKLRSQGNIPDWR